MDFWLPPLRGVSLWLYFYLLISLVAAYKPLSDSFLRAIPSPGSEFDIDNTTGILAPLLIPRVPGTPGQAVAQHHLVDYFKRELPNWTITWQNSTQKTPTSKGKKLPFANLIIRREPPWVQPGQANFLTLVAHYDSKLKPDGFIGATDSAAPCAMIMWAAKVVDKYAQQMYDEMSELGEGGDVDMDMGIQILFLDGEEAFKTWTDTDSLYGSRYVLNPRDRPGCHRILTKILDPYPISGLTARTHRPRSSTNTKPPFRRYPSSCSSTSSDPPHLAFPPTILQRTGPTVPSPTSRHACVRSIF